MKDYKYYVEKLELLPHVEGGFYRQTYLTDEKVTLEDGRVRHLSSSILFLLTASNPSHFHRLKSDEIWFYHGGSSLTVHILTEEGKYKKVSLGFGEGEVLQYTVPKGAIFGSTVESSNKDDFSIVSCVVSPAFSFEDFELFTKKELLEKYPDEKEIIDKLAYEKLS